MKKTLLILIGGTFLIVGYKNLPSGKDNFPNPISNGAPAASTGAPDEKHCSTSGCHSDFAPNTGIAELTASITNGVTHYELGKTYQVAVSISNPGLVRFGFQAVALNSDSKNTGSIRIIDKARTQIIPGYGTMTDRKYATYTYEGTNAVSTGLGKWSFEWTAPETNEGDITFYFASVAANNDGTDAGDYSYSKKITLASPAVSWSVHPNVSSSMFSIECSAMPLDIKLFSASGKKVFERKNIEPGTQFFELNEPNGVYFIGHNR